MPKMNNPNMELVNTASHYGFSATKVDALGASEYTLCTILTDQSGSLTGFDRDLEKMIAEAVLSCKKSPRSENLMIRVVTFNDQESEQHGFKLLETIGDKDYVNTINTGGMTLLFDSTYHAIEATNDYARILKDQDYLTNAIIFVVSDGMDNQSKYGPIQIRKLIEQVKKDEYLESISVLLIGMCGDPQAQTYLNTFQQDAGLTDYIEMGAVTQGKLAKLAKFVSKSTSSTSQALGTGGPSTSLKI